MTRPDAIQQIVWMLLAYADTPRQAVAAARTVSGALGRRAQADFRNVLRAAGLFARDDDGFFVRYASESPGKPGGNGLLKVPAATHLLTVPVPVEPRMRVAYSVFTGLLLKRLYQRHGAVPVQVGEGMALLWVPQESQLPPPADVWKEFQGSPLAEEALRDGVVASLSAVGNIGAVGLSDSLALGPLPGVLLSVLPRYERKFQAHGGMRLDFFLKEEVRDWQRDLGMAKVSDESVEDVWQSVLSGADPDAAAKKIAALLLEEQLRDTTGLMTVRRFSSLWHGEGSGGARKRGRKENLEGRSPKAAWKGLGERAATAEQVDSAVGSFLGSLDARRQGTRELDRWVEAKLGGRSAHEDLVNRILERLGGSVVAQPLQIKTPEIDARPVLGEIVKAWRDETMMPLISPGEIPAALEATVGNVLAWQLARRIEASDVAVFGWPVTVMKAVPQEQRFALRFIKKSDPSDATRILRVPPLGDVVRCAEKSSSTQAPFTLDSLTQSGGAPNACVSFPSTKRCIVCGATEDLIAGAKSFLPESKKRWYESPTAFVEPRLCSGCAFVAYLSAIYPSEDATVAEFPADNFLELFALHEHLQGVSGMMALKVVNRVATMAVLPSRYLLLSKATKRGAMDSKVQVYAQLRAHASLLKGLDRSMRVQIEGGQPQFSAEIHPHVAVGLSHFAWFPKHYESADRKVLAQRVTRALVEGRPFEAFYWATAARQPEKGFGRERGVLTQGLRAFEAEFVRVEAYAARLAHALGGGRMSANVYEDVIGFSNYLLDVVRPLVQREVEKGRSAVSGVARKYTELITRDFGDGRAARFLYAVCQEADSAERHGDGWAKWELFEKLYGGRPDVKGKSGEEAARIWSAFRNQHPKTDLEARIEALHGKHGTDAGLWSKFLGEVQARTLALLMLNVRNAQTR